MFSRFFFANGGTSSLRWLGRFGLAGGAALASVAVACGSSSRAGFTQDLVDGGDAAVVPDASRSFGTEQDPAGTCPSAPTSLLGTAPRGAPCASFADCVPSCCACAGKGALVAACVDGQCVSSVVACGLADVATCEGEGDAGPADAGSVTVDGGALCVPGTADRCLGDSRWTGSSCCRNGPVTCTSGTLLECGGADEHWTGTVCCVDGAVVCGPGNADQCAFTDEYWTGTECCVGGAPTCVPGELLSCNGFGVHWTGSQCCVEGPVLCVPGTADACSVGDEHWTGSQCCVSNAGACVAGTAVDCVGTGTRWTGAQCCIDGPATCVAGTADACTGDHEHWTGSLCCVEGAPTCVGGSALDCTGPGEHWTGSLCCVD